MTDFSSPRRMGGRALAVIFLKHSRDVFNACLIFSLVKIFSRGFDIYNPSDWLMLLGLLVGIIIISFISALAKYLPHKFYVKNGSLIFTHGLIQRQTTTIPLDRIHTLRTKRGIIYRLVGMRGISFDTLASKMEEIELILSENDWQLLLRQIEKEEIPSVESNQETIDDAPNIAPKESTIRFSNNSLMADALCQNHFKGMLVLFGILVSIFNQFDELIDNIDESVIDDTSLYIEEWLATPFHVIGLMIEVYVLVLFLWLGKVLFRYYDMSVRIDKNILTFSGGMISRSSNRFSFGKVCTILVKRNIFEQKFGLCTLKFMQALFASGEKEEDRMKLYGSDSILFLLKWWLGEEYESEQAIITSKSGRGVLVHTAALGVTLSVIAIVILCFLHLYVWIILPAICTFIFLSKGLCAMRRSSITLHGSYIVVENGSFADVKNFLKYENIEVVRIKRTPLTPLFHRASLSIATPGSSYTIRSLKESDAILIYEQLLFRAYNP